MFLHFSTFYPVSGQDSASVGICKFLEDEEKLVVSAGNKIGCRSTNGEQIFLSTILQVSEVPENGLVTVELDIVKVTFFVQIHCLILSIILVNLIVFSTLTYCFLWPNILHTAGIPFESHWCHMYEDAYIWINLIKIVASHL